MPGKGNFPMSMYIAPAGRAGYAAANLDMDAASGLLSTLLRLDGTVTDTAVKAITGVTNATPAVITSTSHGFANGDIVVVRGVGGAIGVNQLGKVANQTANTFTLQTMSSETIDVSAGGAYTSGGCVINLTKSLNRADYDGAAIGSTYTIPTTTVTLGVVKPSASLTFSAVPDLSGGQVHAHFVSKASGSAATDTGLFFYDGRIKVTCNTAAATSATTINVEPIMAGIASGAVLVFSNGVSATLTAPATKGARSLAVSALSSGIAIGHEAEAPINTTPNFPITTNGGDIVVSIDATEGLFTA